jgi:hypothetical protein
MDSFLPVVTASSFIVRAIEWDDGEPQHDLGPVNMLWDTGAHSTLVPEELLPKSFRDYLSDPIHDGYRLAGGSRVQMEILVHFPDVTFFIEAVALVLSQSYLPNQHDGIIFGQKGCIGRMEFRSIPRLILEGDDANDAATRLGNRGCIIIAKYRDLEGKLHVL